MPADLATIYDLNPLFAKRHHRQGPDHRGDRGYQSLLHLGLVRPSAPRSGSRCIAPARSPPFTRRPRQAQQLRESGRDSAATTAKRFWMPNGHRPRRRARASWWQPAPTPTPPSAGLIAMQNLVNSPNPPIHHEHQLWRVRSGKRRVVQRRVQRSLSAGGGGRNFGICLGGRRGRGQLRRQSPGATHGIGVSAFASTPYNVAVGGTDFSDTYLGHQRHLLEHHQQRSPTARRSLTSPKCPGTIPAPAALLAQFPGLPAAMDPRVSAPRRDRARGWISHRGGRKRRPKRLRHGIALQLRRDRRNVQRLCEADLASRRGRHSQRRRARHPGCLFIRRQRPVGTLLRLSAGPTQPMAARLAWALPADGRARAERPSPRRSWPASRRW